MSEFQSALRARFDADRDFTRAHDQLGKFIDDLIMENEGLRRVIALEAPYTLDAPFEGQRRALQPPPQTRTGDAMSTKPYRPISAAEGDFSLRRSAGHAPNRMAVGSSD